MREILVLLLLLCSQCTGTLCNASANWQDTDLANVIDGRVATWFSPGSRADASALTCVALQIAVETSYYVHSFEVSVVRGHSCNSVCPGAVFPSLSLGTHTHRVVLSGSSSDWPSGLSTTVYTVSGKTFSTAEVESSDFGVRITGLAEATHSLYVDGVNISVAFNSWDGVLSENQGLNTLNEMMIYVAISAGGLIVFLACAGIFLLCFMPKSRNHDYSVPSSPKPRVLRQSKSKTAVSTVISVRSSARVGPDPETGSEVSLSVN